MKLGSRTLLLFSPIILLLMGLAGCNTTEIQSVWRDRAITIDGNGDEWNNALACYVDESRVLLGVTNDATDLYLRLSTSDRSLQRQLQQAGCTVWFDAKGGKDKVFGLHFPLGGPMEPPPGFGKREQGPGQAPPGGIARQNEQFRGMLQDAQQFVEILRPGSEDDSRFITLAEANKLGIELGMSVSKNMLVYEVKVPLVGNDGSYPFVVAPHGVKIIGVGFAATEMAGGDKPPGPGRGPGGFGGGSGGGPGGNFPGGGGGGMPPPRGKFPEPFELWTKVTLADSSAAR